MLKKESYLLVMHQEVGMERTLSENCVALLAASMGLYESTVMREVLLGQMRGIKECKTLLLDHVRKSSPNSMTTIDQTFDLSASVRSELESVLTAYDS
jgi:hypothetical protein